MVGYVHLLDEESEGQLGDNVRDIGHGEGDRVLPVGEAEVDHEAGRLCVANVGALVVSTSARGITQPWR